MTLPGDFDNNGFKEISRTDLSSPFDKEITKKTPHMEKKKVFLHPKTIHHVTGR